MSDVTIRVENLGKRYRIGVRDQQRETLAQSVFDSLNRPVRNLRRLVSLSRFDERQDGEDIVWAVRDLSFEVGAGEVLGIIGRNGAGKSTLLKLLTRITKPTHGRFTINGSLSSLLEVGTGFHPELTGRDNVFLNGAILGMSHREVACKFDEIASFSGVERFLDTPVKRYSSGMKVRLAFSVAAHLDPDILLVDEVLSVGDADFQKRCLGKMNAVAQRGRTVLFVSHNLAAVTRLCGRILLLDNGRLIADGPPTEVVSKYLSSEQGSMVCREWADPATAPGGNVARLRSARIYGTDGRSTEAVDIREPLIVEFAFDVLTGGRLLVPHVMVKSMAAGMAAFTSIDIDSEWRGRPRPIGCYRCRVVIPGNLLSEGMYTVAIALRAGAADGWQFGEDLLAFHVVDSTDGTTARGDWHGAIPGVLRPKLEWTTEHLPALPPIPEALPKDSIARAG